MSSHDDTSTEQTVAAREIEEMRRSNSEAFSILGTELAEVKSMLMVLLDLQKSVIFSTGMSEADVEKHVETLLAGYREKFLAVMAERVKSAAAR
jgi:sialic acid synthase SpsE